MTEALALPRDPTPSASATAESPVYKRFALILLMIIYAFNMLDRQIVTILAEPIKASLHLADWQLGAVTGLAFAVFYTLLGIPVARLADRADRVRLIGGSLAVWSVFTMVCGLARSFPALLLARFGVGFGEAGCTPAAHSLIAETTPRAKLASALAFYSLGIPLGSLIGLTMGGLIADSLGWRAAFLLAGAPGLLLAAAAVLALREPRRLLDRLVRRSHLAPLGEALGELRRKRSFWWVSSGAGLAAFVYYGQAAFYGSLFLRTHTPQIATLARQFGLGSAGFLGLALGLIVGVSSGLGTFIGGQLADRAARRDVRGYARLPMILLVVAAPLFAFTPLAGNVQLSLALLAPAIFTHALCYGPTFASVQCIASPGVRAMASAISLFFMNLVGLALGPLTVGLLSDQFTLLYGPVHGLRLAMSAVAVLMLASAACFCVATRTLKRDAYAVD
jgi:MFS family permease